MKTQKQIFAMSFLALTFPMLAHAGMAPAVATAPQEKTPAPAECTGEYKTASGYFQTILGDDASLARIPAFIGEYSAGPMKLTAANAIKDGGGPVYLEVNLSMAKIPFGAPIHVPVKVCKTGGKLTATLIMSGAVFKSPKGDKPVAGGMLKDIPTEIVIAVTRAANKDVVFKSETFPNQPASAVTVR